ncbi:Predicted arabinose efflux permease, MFS family [Evansella caseinilytica]|uniref:Predicted arabinose efflux permease, MFS family n=1 Tax=Evansella caseinilytica TaxID=1503961 RepID=A0A1H3SJ30_9BACI|nr:MFS transporter [Evansella caseinilytica]SDZ37972.1 Predicted arabinose efflux permease, MFS family [Evansella caseinilytica]
MKNQVLMDSALSYGKPRPLWRNRTFAFIFSGYVLSIFGNSFHSIALNLWVLQTTGSAKLMSTIIVTHMTINILFGSIAGTVADRVERKKLMWGTDMVRSILVLGIAFCVAFQVPFIFILILTALTAFAGLFQAPAFQASLVDIVGREKVQQATGIINIADNISRITGLALGGMVVAIFGGVTAIVLDSVTFFISSILVFLAGTIPHRKRNAGNNNFKEDFIIGFKHLWKNPFARSVIILSPTLNMFFITSLMLIQVMAVKVWNATPVEFGVIEACIPLGYMLGAGFIVLLDKKLKHRGLYIVVSMLSIAPVYIILSFITSSRLAIPIILTIGFMFSFCTLLVNIIMRLEIDSELQGRMFGILGSITSIAPSIGLVISSIFADIFGASMILMINGIGLLFAGIIVVVLFKPIWSYH